MSGSRSEFGRDHTVTEGFVLCAYHHIGQMAARSVVRVRHVGRDTDARFFLIRWLPARSDNDDEERRASAVEVIRHRVPGTLIQRPIHGDGSLAPVFLSHNLLRGGGSISKHRV